MQVGRIRTPVHLCTGQLHCGLLVGDVGYIQLTFFRVDALPSPGEPERVLKTPSCKDWHCRMAWIILDNSVSITQPWWVYSRRLGQLYGFPPPTANT